MRIILLILLAGLLFGCGTADRPLPILSDEELTSPDAFVRSVRIGNTTYLYRRHADDPNLFDIRVSGSRRTNEKGLLDAVSRVYGCSSLRVVGMNRTRTAGRVQGTSCRLNQYYR
ncbi:hypothetical protein [Algihabitans sp.]|uniref:hypothetical protein n=1 Tax=Algihabitans sp. TaxID=2821514 RepID=UPI003BA90783